MTNCNLETALKALIQPGIILKVFHSRLAYIYDTIDARVVMRIANKDRINSLLKNPNIWVYQKERNGTTIYYFNQDHLVNVTPNSVSEDIPLSKGMADFFSHDSYKDCEKEPLHLPQKPEIVSSGLDLTNSVETTTYQSNLIDFDKLRSCLDKPVRINNTFGYQTWRALDVPIEIAHYLAKKGICPEHLSIQQLNQIKEL